jgi:S-DNA-T family DNA segregation ATPase FtsK/SpoIIIE
MDLRWTVVDASRTGASVDVRVSAPRGTTLGAVRDGLDAAVGKRGAAATLCVAGEPVSAASVVGLPPLLDGSVVVTEDAAPGRRPQTPATAGLLELHVVAGPDAGIVVPLTPGRWTVGRAAEAHIRIGDLRLSRVHLVLDVGTDGVRLRDSGSTNGTSAAGQPVEHEFLPVDVDVPIRAGSSTLMLRAPGGRPAVWRPDGRGHLLVNRPPRIRPGKTPGVIEYPTPPPPLRHAGLPWPAMFLPLLVSVPLALWWRQPAFLLFAAMTPVMLLGQYLADRRSGRREHRRREAAYRREVDTTDDAVRRAVEADLAGLESEARDLARLGVVARLPEETLWRCRPADGLEVRLGRGARPARVVVRHPSPADGEPVASTRPTDVTPDHADAPITVDLQEIRVLGIAGPRRTGLALARSLVGQLGVACSPAELALEVVSAGHGHGDWAWTTWLPHHRSDAARPATPPAESSVSRVVVVDGVRLAREQAEVAELLRDAEHLGITVICLDDDGRKLPLECRATVEIGEAPADSVDAATDLAGSGAAVFRRQGGAPVTVALDLAGMSWAESLARALARLRDATPSPGDALPESVSLVDLLRRTGVDATQPSEVMAAWEAPGAASEAATVIGLGPSGPVTLDLRRDGPHALVAGMTGSGKSQLLESLVFGLAVRHPPDAVSFVLVDYKGGAAFRECRHLPHVTGLVTDLDNRLAARALASLRAELRRRERLLAAAGASDLDDYTARRAQARSVEPAAPPLPRLVVVVDEFRVLAEELPEFVAGLVRIAAVGRSLGVHLVLATQRPAGVVSAEIRANTNLRVALRVRDRQDSEDVVDGPQAAALPADRPGRAVLRVGGGPHAVVQVAHVSGSRRRAAPTVVRLGEPHPGAAATPAVDAGERLAAGEAATVLHAVTEAARRRGVPPPEPPWLPPLPPSVTLPGLLTAAGAPEPPSGAVIGLADDPGNQRYVRAEWSLRGRNLAVAGGPRSGRSTLLRSLAASTMHRRPDTHVYVIDAAGALHDLVDLPHVGAVVAAADVERADRLLAALTAEIGRRRTSGHEERPDVVLLVDGWEATTAAWAAYEHGRLVDALLEVLRDGGAVGVHVALSGDRALLSGPPASLLGDRVLLRFADPLTATMAGVPASRVAATQAPGRGFWAPADGALLDLQVAVAPRDPMACGAAAGPAKARPWTVPSLPDVVRRDELDVDDRDTTDGRRRRIVVGAGVPDVRRRPPGASGPVPLHLELPVSGVVPVLGPPGSGRSTALAVLATEAARIGLDAVLVSDDGNLASPTPPGLRVVDTASVDASALLARALAAAHDPVVLVDDAERLPPEVAAQIHEIAPMASVVVATTATAVLGAYGGLLGSARSARDGLMLGAVRAGDGEALGLRIGPAPAGPRGRGRLVTRGRAVAVQVLLPDSDGRQVVAEHGHADLAGV